MAKGHHHDGADDIRIFLPVYGEVKPSKFASEKQMQNLVETSLGMLFPGLKLLASEFWIAQDKYRLDTVAFDERANTFVAIEYKNRVDAGVPSQAMAYLAEMGRHRSDLALEYYKKFGKQKSFDWASMYAIIMAPEFDSYLQTGNREFARLEVHEIKLYENLVVTVRRVGGGHEGVPPGRVRDVVVDVPPERPTLKPEKFHQELSDKTRQLFDYVDGALRDRFVLKRDLKQKQANYGLGSGRDILWIYPGKTQLRLWHIDSGEDLPDALNDALASANKIHDSGFYKSNIKTEQDFEQIVPLLKHVIGREQGHQ